MDTNVLQTLRYKLQKRLKRINTAGQQFYHDILVQTWRFLEESILIKGILDELVQRVPTAESDSEKMFSGKLLSGETELEHVALCYWLVRRCANSESGRIEATLSSEFRISSGKTLSDYQSAFTESFVEPLFDYIDEQIDDHRTTLSLLLKYKHRVEWFFRDELRERFASDTQRGEKQLALNLYAYLHDQGLEFSIEPTSISGEADLISAQTDSDRLVADVKIFDPERSKGVAYLCNGFHQVYQYTKDYNDPFGYLIVFKTCEADISVNAPHQESTIPFFSHNNKTIFVLIIDIFNYPTSASKRGGLKSYELNEADLKKVIS